MYYLKSLEQSTLRWALFTNKALSGEPSLLTQQGTSLGIGNPWLSWLLFILILFILLFSESRSLCVIFYPFSVAGFSCNSYNLHIKDRWSPCPIFWVLCYIGREVWPIYTYTSIRNKCQWAQSSTRRMVIKYVVITLLNFFSGTRVIVGSRWFCLELLFDGSMWHIGRSC